MCIGIGIGIVAVVVMVMVMHRQLIRVLCFGKKKKVRSRQQFAVCCKSKSRCIDDVGC